MPEKPQDFVECSRCERRIAVVDGAAVEPMWVRVVGLTSTTLCRGCGGEPQEGPQGLDPVQLCAQEIVDHVHWKAPEQINAAVGESLWNMTQALKLDPEAVKLEMQQISREVHNTSKDFVDAGVVARRLRRALGEADDA